MKEAGICLVSREGGDILEIANQFKNHEIMPTKTEAKRLEKELSEEHLEYNGVALTKNYIIKVAPAVSNDYIVEPDNTILWNNSFSWAKYDEVLWVYTEESTGHPLGNIVEITAGALVDAAILGTVLPRSSTGIRAVLAIYPKDRKRAMIISDEKKYSPGMIRSIKGKIKVSDDFYGFKNEIISRIPKKYYDGDTPENKAAYYKAIGEKMPVKKPEYYQQQGGDNDYDDDML